MNQTKASMGYVTSKEPEISLGSEITVPCHLSPEVCAIAMQIKWFKETVCVCIYKNGCVIKGRSYKDRASLATCVLERGNVSLNLSNFSVSDVGDYYCQVISRDTTKQITVGVDGLKFINAAWSKYYQICNLHSKFYTHNKHLV
uniref:Ig-like domain-containing protein n=1 Tax=Cyprinus carpio TaxID=7962 RepID=A0A8C1S0B1_CYPCA